MSYSTSGKTRTPPGVSTYAVTMVEQQPRMETSHGRLLYDSTDLSADEIVEIVENRAVIERVKGMLMLVYDIDEAKAFDLLKSRSQTTNIKLRLIAMQLVHDIVEAGRRQADMRLACDGLLLTVQDRIPRDGPQPSQGEA